MLMLNNEAEDSIFAVLLKLNDVNLRDQRLYSPYGISAYFRTSALGEEETAGHKGGVWSWD